MDEDEIARLRELTLLLDLAYLHHFKGAAERAKYKSAEATVRLEFGNFWYRKKNPSAQRAGPEIENVVVYTSVFSAAPVSYFDTLEEALGVVRGWYDDAKASNAA
jgi:hypothetical protein